MTGDAVTDFAVEAGPKVFGFDLPPHVRFEIARSKSLSWYREIVKLMAQHEVAEMHREIEFVSQQNRQIEFQARNGFGVPHHRIPLSVHLKMEDLYGAGCWKDNEFVEDFLAHHPGLRIKVTRGTKGQEYGGRGSGFRVQGSGVGAAVSAADRAVAEATAE